MVPKLLILLSIITLPPHTHTHANKKQTGMELPMDGFSPRQRLLLTANGNVQRIVSAFYDAPVTVHLLLSQPSMLGGHERIVSMSVLGWQFMSARSSVHLLTAEWASALASGVPLGSLCVFITY
ncbi:hypothetical protein T492DRAFT_1015746 [Pavlovales sp. CCMP2436]|nr:hypothetical protein T492DRAFT_1015746 [Pavlovales sp. CCMP2436]